MAAILWAVFALALFGVQFATGLIDLVFLGIAALLTAALSAIVPGFGGAFWLQAATWLVTSFLTLIFLRKRFRKLFKGDELKTIRDEYSGREALVVEAISPGHPGRISFQGTTWTAVSLDEEIAVGARAFILEQQDMHFVVASKLIGEDPSR